MGATQTRRAPSVKDIAVRLKHLGFDPIEQMAKRAMSPKLPPEARADIAAELALYVRPRVKTGWPPNGSSPFAAAEGKLKALGFDPIECLAKIALDDQNREHVRLKALRYLARDYPLPGGQRPTDDALRRLLR